MLRTLDRVEGVDVDADADAAATPVALEEEEEEEGGDGPNNQVRMGCSAAGRSSGAEKKAKRGQM